MIDNTAIISEYDAATKKLSDLASSAPMALRVAAEIRYQRASRRMVRAGLIAPLSPKYDGYR